MNLAKYVVQLEAQTAQYVAELQKANTELKKFHKDQTDALDAIQTAFKALAGYLSVRMFVNFVDDSIRAGAEMVTLSNRLGVSVTALSELQYAAKVTNIPFAQLTTSMQFMERNLVAASKAAGRGSTGTAAALQDLNLSAKQLIEMPTNKALEVITDALGKMSNKAQALGDAVQIFGRGGAVMMQLAGQLGDLTKAAEAAGVVMTEEMAIRAEIAQKAMDVLGLKVKMAGMEFGIAFGPAITGLINQINVSFGNLGNFFDAVVDKLVAGVGIIEDAIWGWRIIIQGVELEVAKLHDLWIGLINTLSGRFGVVVKATLSAMADALGPAGIAIKAMVAAMDAGAITANEKAASQLNALKNVYVGAQGLIQRGNVEITAQLQAMMVYAEKDPVYGFLTGVETLIPKVDELGKALSDEQAINKYLATGKSFGQFAEGFAAPFADALKQQQAALSQADLMAPALQEAFDKTVAMREPWAVLKDKVREAREEAQKMAAALTPKFDAEAALDAWNARMKSGDLEMPEFDVDAAIKAWTTQMSSQVNKVPPPLLTRPGTPGMAGGPKFEEGNFADVQHAMVLDKIKKQEEEQTKFLQRENAKRTQGDIDAWNYQMKLDKQQAQARLALNTNLTMALGGLLQALGAQHRGAAIAAIAIETFRTIRTLHLASLVAQGEAAASVAFLGPGAMAAAAMKVRIMYGIWEALAAATGAVQAAQISGGGTQATLGSSANPISTTGGSSAGTAVTSQAQNKNVVQIVFQGDVFGWDETMKKRIVDSLRDLIDNKDVVIIGPNSRQALVLGP